MCNMCRRGAVHVREAQKGRGSTSFLFWVKLAYPLARLRFPPTIPNTVIAIHDHGDFHATGCGADGLLACERIRIFTS